MEKAKPWEFTAADVDENMMQDPDAHGVPYNTLQWQKHYLDMNAATKGGPYQTPQKKKKRDNDGGDIIQGVDKDDDEFSEVRSILQRTPAHIHNQDNNFEEFYTLDKEESDDFNKDLHELWEKIRTVAEEILQDSAPAATAPEMT